MVINTVPTWHLYCSGFDFNLFYFLLFHKYCPIGYCARLWALSKEDFLLETDPKLLACMMKCHVVMCKQRLSFLFLYSCLSLSSKNLDISEHNFFRFFWHFAQGRFCKACFVFFSSLFWKGNNSKKMYQNTLSQETFVIFFLKQRILKWVFLYSTIFNLYHSE